MDIGQGTLWSIQYNTKIHFWCTHYDKNIGALYIYIQTILFAIFTMILTLTFFFSPVVATDCLFMPFITIPRYVDHLFLDSLPDHSHDSCFYMYGLTGPCPKRLHYQYRAKSLGNIYLHPHINKTACRYQEMNRIFSVVGRLY